ncbi:hypothetical protein K1T71_011948 [Dendrolimus kikuchii]|uniref:Uncharacterized protein n=1 Tax=Dendrolimus kikuchii TaxID=765133 RepID=A0ACC1CN31_9NEOP|nr:hypothetical protein K1T71_011948 [Dendrolimus kikuchii]
MELAENISNKEKGKPDIKPEICKHNKPLTKIRKLQNIAKTGFVTSLDEFAQNSTLHGLRYIVDRTLSYIEKLFWLIVVIASITMCSLLIHNVWIKWQNSPIIITMDEKLVPVDSVPYPSLTICPQIKIKDNPFKFQADLGYYDDIIWNVYNETSDQIMLSEFSDIALVCDDDLRGNIAKSQISNNTVNIDSILKVALDFEDIFESCYWNNNPTSCKSLFQKVLIREGVCFTTNALGADEIIRTENVMNRLFLSDKNYRDNLSALYPIRGSANDALAEFVITLRENAEYEDKSCKRYYTGFVVYLQNPADMPQALIQPYKVVTNEIMSLALKFDTVSTSDDLKSYPIQTRQCFFPDEPYLQFFLTYTESNCRMECFTNYTKQLCGCVAFYMPRDNATRICSVYYMQCVDIAQILLFGSLHPKKVDQLMYMNSNSYNTMNISLINNGKEFARACNCLPTCNTVNYEADVMKVQYDFEYYFKAFCNEFKVCDKENKSYKYAQIEWIFKQPTFVGMVRSSIFGVTDFIAQCGGLLGLFLGFSFLTVVEIIYYLTMRFGFIVARKQKLTNVVDKTV